jgi:Ribbon-helix-helix protein, copG family.
MTQQAKTNRGGRPSKPDSEKHLVPTMVKLQPKLRQQIESLAKQRRMTLSAYLRQMLEEHVCFEEAA